MQQGGVIRLYYHSALSVLHRFADRSTPSRSYVGRHLNPNTEMAHHPCRQDELPLFLMEGAASPQNDHKTGKMDLTFNTLPKGDNLGHRR